MADEHVAIRYFRHSDPKPPYADTHYQAGDSYSGRVEDNQLSDEGPDGNGPVLKKVPSKPAPSKSADSSGKDN